MTVTAPTSVFVKTVGTSYVLLEESDGITRHRIDGLTKVLVRPGMRLRAGEPVGVRP